MLQRDAGVARPENRPVGDRLIQQLLVVVGAGDVTLQEQVRVGVDHARQHGHRREIDHARVARLRLYLGERADRLDALAFYQDPHASLDRLAAAVDQATRLDENRLRGSRCGGLLGGERGDGEQSGGQLGGEETAHGVSW